MHKFDTKVQHLKYKVLREVARLAWADSLLDHLMDVPKQIVPGNKPTMRCCVYKERAILGERVKLAMGGSRENPNVIEVIDIACDECPMGGYEVTNACRGCLAHRCEDACRFGAIILRPKPCGTHRQGKVQRVRRLFQRYAPTRPSSAASVRAKTPAKSKPSHMNEARAAAIDNSKCIACGACVYQCPFGAIIGQILYFGCHRSAETQRRKP